MNSSSAALHESFVGQLAQHSTVWLVFGALLALSLLVAQIGPKQAASEPPLLKPSIPVIGHIIGLMRWKAEYFSRLQ
jgi:hypothetical protein